VLDTKIVFIGARLLLSGAESCAVLLYCIHYIIVGGSAQEEFLAKSDFLISEKSTRNKPWYAGVNIFPALRTGKDGSAL
jgi:hypothetical protein